MKNSTAVPLQADRTAIRVENSTAPRPVSDRWFYLAVAIASCLLVFAGFARSYFLRTFFGFHAMPAFFHLHGLVMSLWFVLFFVQVGLIATRHTQLHRGLGVVGMGLAAMMTLVTGMVVIRAAQRGFTPFPETVNWPGFLLFGLGVVLTFAALFSAAILLRRRSATHKRLMVLATVSIFGAAISRLPLRFIEEGTLWTSIAVWDVCVLLCVAVDTMRHRRLHPAFLWGGLWILISHPLSIWIGNTAAWSRIATWMLR
jgi:hypothetical protein